MSTAASIESPSVMTTADGTPLKVSLQRAMRRARLKAFLLVAPLLAFILITFLMPIGDMLFRSVQNPEVVTILANTSEALKEWDGTDLPPESVYAALAADIAIGNENRSIGQVGTRLNYQMPGLSSAVRKTARAERSGDLVAPFKESFIDIDRDWGKLEVWQLIQREASPYTDAYYLAAVDRVRSPEGNIEALPDTQQIHVQLFLRTFVLSIVITLLTIVLGFPIAHLLAILPASKANLLMILVLLPFWTSLLVRTTAWIVMLQSQGVLNDMLVAIGLVGDDNRLQMIYNQTGTIIAMTHILLPFMVLPLYSVMKTIPPNYVRAARSLGANNWVAFWKVYVPQTMAGIGAGSVLVFILAIGYYITPALVGGSDGQLISNRIAFHMQQSLNWGLAAALGAILLGIVLVLYIVYNRLVGIDKMKLG